MGTDKKIQGEVKVLLKEIDKCLNGLKPLRDKLARDLKKRKKKILK